MTGSITTSSLADVWRRRATVRYGTGLALFTLVTLIWLSPLLPRLGSTVLVGASDQTGGIAEYSAMEAQHQSPFTFNHNPFNGAPEGLPDPAAERVAQPIQPLFVWALKSLVGITAALNLYLILGFILTAATAFAFLDWLGCTPLSSVFGTYVIAFNPWVFNRAFAGHDGFLQGWVLIAVLWAFVNLDRSRSLRAAALFGGAFGLCFWVASYLGLLASLIVAVGFLVILFRSSSWADRLWVATLACVTLGVTFVFLLPGAIAYVTHRSTVVQALGNPVSELQTGAASLASYLLPSYRHPVFGGITRHFLTSNQSERTLFFGYTTIVLAAIAVWRLVRRRAGGLSDRQRSVSIAAAVLVPLAFIASLPRIAHVGPIEFPTLSYFVGAVTTYFRAYVRFGYVAGIALAILASLSLTRITSRRASAIRLALLAVLVFELLPGSVSAWAHGGPRSYDRWLATQPAGIVAQYPMPTDQKAALDLANREFYYERFNHHPLFTIYGAGYGDSREGAIRLLVRYVTDAVTPGVLAAEGVHYVVLHDDVYRAEGQKPPALSRPDFVPVARFGDIRVFTLHAAPTSVDAALQVNQASLGLVEGLTVPAVSLGAGFEQGSGSQTFPSQSSGQGTVTLDNTAGVPSVQLIVTATGSANDKLTVSLSGVAIGTLTLQPTTSNLAIGSLALPRGQSQLTFSAAKPFTVSSVQVQPLADITTKLNP